MTIILLVAGVIIIVGVFILVKKKSDVPPPLEPITVGGDNENNNVSPWGGVEQPDNPEINTIEPIEGAEGAEGVATVPQNIVDYNTPTYPTEDIEGNTDLSYVDTSNFPKPGDNVVVPEKDTPEKLDEEFELSETLYKQTFANPINPNIEKGKHKAIYNKVQDIVHFTVKYPTQMPEGFMLTKIEANEGDILETGRYYGANIITYETDANQKIEIIEGIIDMGSIVDIEKVEIKKGVMGMLWKWRWYGDGEEDTESNDLGLTVYSGGSIEDYQYYIIGENVDKSDILYVAKNLESVNPNF